LGSSLDKMNSIDLEIVNRFLLQKQHLTDDSRSDDVCQVVRDIGGLHATGTKEPYLALFARMRNFTREQLDEELYINRTLGKIRCMRGTLYILTGDMLPVAYTATRAMIEKFSTRFMEFRGISQRDYNGFARSVMKLISGKRMTIHEIKAQLKIDVNLSAVLNLMCDRGLLLRIQQGKGWESKSYCYASFTEYFPDVDLNEVNESESIVLLVQRYLDSFGPATEDDIVWWTGLTKTKIREALRSIAGRLTHIAIPDIEGDFLILSSDLHNIQRGKLDAEPVVNLLPLLDPYLMGYKQRLRYLRYKDYDKIFDRSGNATSTVLLNGRVIGIWDFSVKPEPVMKVHLLDKVAGSTSKIIESKARRLGSFIADREVPVRHIQSMTPLVQRTAGGFMSPLKDDEPRFCGCVGEVDEILRRGSCAHRGLADLSGVSRRASGERAVLDPSPDESQAGGRPLDTLGPATGRS